MQESFAFLILGVGRLREDQFIYVETRENAFFIIWDLLKHPHLPNRNAESSRDSTQCEAFPVGVIIVWFSCSLPH